METRREALSGRSQRFVQGFEIHIRKFKKKKIEKKNREISYGEGRTEREGEKGKEKKNSGRVKLSQTPFELRREIRFDSIV